MVEVKKRRLRSWIEAFSEQATALHTPLIWRKWVGISVLAAALEQKVWMVSGGKSLHPNLYLFLIGHPGTGKTRTMMEGRAYLNRLPEPHFSPTSMTWASLVDALGASGRLYLRAAEGDLKYNSLYICVDELGAFMSKFDTEITKGLSAMYDPTPYRQTRRTGALDVKIESPQVNMIIGTTPQDLLDFLPDSAWGQGFMSRSIMIFSDERIIGDDFAVPIHLHTDDLDFDLGIINETFGQFNLTPEWIELVNAWRREGEPPVPDHPRLTHYNTRRRVNLYKLSMISSIDRGQSMIIDVIDLKNALDWLTEAESFMADIFKAGAVNADAQAMEDIRHYVLAHDVGWGVSEQKISRFARDLLPMATLERVITTMVRTGDLHFIGQDTQSKAKFYSTQPSRPEPES